MPEPSTASRIAVHCETDDRQGIEQLDRYNMGALAQARVRSGGFYAARGAGFER